MAGGRQLRLLLWKDYLIRKRNFITLGGIIWATGIMFAFYIVRINIDNQDFPTCQFPARALPSAGVLPFLQSFICSVSNECSPMDQFQEIPSYENAKFTQMQRKLAPLLNDTVLELASSMPDAVRLLAALADIADDPTFRDFSKNGLRFEDLFSNPSRVKRYVTSHLELDDDVSQALMTSEISFQGLINGDLNRCSPQSLSQTLAVQNSSHLDAIVAKLCAMPAEDLQTMFMDLMYEINFSKYIKMAGNMYYKLSGDDRVTRLGEFLTALLRMTKLQHFLPPEVTSLFYGKRAEFSYLDLSLIQRFIDLFHPTFGDTESYKSIREFADIAIVGIQYTNKIFGDLSNNDTSDEVTGLVMNNIGNRMDVGGLDKINAIFSNAVDVAEGVNEMDSNIDPYKLLTKITQTIYKFLPKSNKHDVLFYSTLISKLMESARKVIEINMHIEELAYNVTLRHPKAAEVLRKLPPNVVGKAFEALVSAERTQILTAKLNFPGQMFCDINKLQGFLIISTSDAESLKSRLCTDAWNNYVADLVKTFGVFDVRNNVNEMASLLIQETLGKDTSSQLYSIEKDFEILKNFTRALVTMDEDKHPGFNWEKLLGVSEESELMAVVREKAHLGRLMLISVHGALAKEIVKQNAILQYKITPILLDATTIVSGLSDQLEATPSEVSDGLKNSYGDVVKTLLMTALDEEKTYKSLSTFCEDILCHGGDNAAIYLQFPDDTDTERLSSVLCNASIAIEDGLKSDSIVAKAIVKIKNTTHSVLDEINWTRLISGVQKLYVKLTKDYPYLFEFSTYAMDKSTQEDIQKLFRSAKDFWFSMKHLERGLHLSIKLGYRVLDILDHGIFNLNSEAWLKMKFVTSSSIGPLIVLDDTVKLVTSLLTNSNHTSALPPTTVAALSRIIPNVPHLIVDSVNIIVRDDTDIQPIISLLNASPPWPCATSMSSLLVLSPPSAEAVQGLETLLCLGTEIREEWATYLDERKASGEVLKSKTWNNTKYEPHLFLQISSTLDALINDTVLVKDAFQYIVNGNSSDDVGLKTAWEYAVTAMNTTERNEILRKFLNKFDTVLTSINTSMMSTNISINGLWEDYVRCINSSYAQGNCRDNGRAAWKYTLRMLSVIFDNVAIDLTTYFTEVNEPDSNLLQMLGFTKNTALYMLYDRLSEFIGVLVNSYWDFGFMSQVRRASLTQFWDCEAIVNALVPAPDSALHHAEIKRIQPYVCPSLIHWLSLPRDENVLFNLVAKPQYYFYSLPAQNATSSFESAFTKATKLAEFLNNVAKENKTLVKDEINVDHIKNTLANYIDKIINYKLEETDPNYRQFSDINRKQIVSNIYLTKIVAIVTKLAAAINNITIDEDLDRLSKTGIEKLNADLNIIKNIFKRKPVDAIAIHYDVLTNTIWTNDDSFTLVDAIDSMCDDVKGNNMNKAILVDQMRTSVQLCAKNYRVLFGAVQNAIEDDYKDARQSLLDLVDVLKSGNDTDVPDIFEFLKSRTEQINSLKRSIKYSYDIGLPLFLKYLQSNLRSYNVVLTFLSGGDWWKALENLYDGPYTRKFFGYVEGSFDIAGQFLNNLDEIHLVRLIRDINFNDTDSFCRPNLTLSDYIPDATHALSELKDQICMTDKIELFREIPPLLYVSQGYESSLALSKDIDYTSLNSDITLTRSYLSLIEKGPNEPQRPAWVTEEKLRLFRRDVINLLSKETITKITFGILGNVVDAGTFDLNSSQCTVCSQLTTWFKQLNLQLFKKQEYDNLLCHLHTMPLEDVYQTLKNDFHWDMLIQELISTRNYTKIELNRSMNDFLGLVKSHLLEDIGAPTTKLTECLAKNVSRNGFGNATLFLTVLSHAAKLLRAEAPHLHEVEGVQNLVYLQQLSEDIAHNLDVFKPLKGYLKKTVRAQLMKVIGDDEVAMDIEGADINLKMAQSAKIELLRLHTNRWEHICEEHNCSVIYDIILDNLNMTKIEKELPSLQMTGYWRFSFASSILQHIEGLLSHIARLSGVASSMDVSGAMAGRLDAMLDVVVRILMDDAFDRVVYSLQGLLDELQPLLKGTPLEHDLGALATGLAIFHQVKTYLVEEEDLKLQVAKWFPNADAIEMGLTTLGFNNTNFWSLAAPRIHEGYIHMTPVLSPKDPNYHISDFVCELDAMATVLQPGAVDVVTADDVLAATAEQFCGIPDARVKELLPVLLRNLDFGIIMDKVKDHLLIKLYSASDLTAEQGSRVLERFPRMAALLPVLRENLGDVMKSLGDEPLFQSLKDFSSVGKLMSSSDFLANAGNMVCGAPFKADMSRIIKNIINTKDLAQETDQAQLDILPNFCRSMYEEITSMEGGKIVWSFVKPLIMGKILYTPRHPTVDRIMEKANTSFASMVRMANLVHSFSSAFPSLDSISSHRGGLQALQHLVTSPSMAALRKMLIGAGEEINIDVDVDDMFDEVGDLKGIGSLLSKASSLLHCINMDRFQQVPDEDQLMQQAAKLVVLNEFSAGIVFLNVDQLNDSLTSVEYKIRMDIENAPTTKWMKPYLWTPGPDASFIENMRYFRGFIQIQDLLDKAIIQLSADGARTKRDVGATDLDWAVYTQQEPYPCYRKDLFQSSLYESQALIVAFFFALLFTVASAVRFIVADKESGNTMLMSVMGVNLTYHSLSWFIASFIEMTVTVGAITALLKWGAVLPRSDSTLVFALLFVFGLSVLSFCYLMSKLFSSASFAAVCGGITYLTTFMPFIIILSLEAVINSSLKALVCLSMSSSLCYAFLYVTRYEAMGVGARWGDVWSSPNDDNMCIAYAAFMIVVDAILYLAIGWCIDRYFGLRALQSSITNCTSRGEKAGVSIVNVSKTYGAGGRREKVALDNVSMELHKGQITALLGHNGAGKTTLINILTGMLKPTKGDIIIRSELANGTRLGVCPQKDVLFEYMTAREHIVLYAQLKSGLGEDEVQEEVNRMLQVLCLGHVCDLPVATLSGGTRRRLCVALAFVARPTLVSLDEPTAGVDPAARRDIWSMIVKLKEDRTILLTTHHLDEAELLSDQIVIMHKGQIHTTGSPIEIKRALGSGYKLTVALPERAPEAWGCSAQEQTARLLAVVRGVVNNAGVLDVGGGQAEIALPFYDTDGANNNFLQLCTVLEESQPTLGFKSFALDCSSLEQVFFDICQRADHLDADRITDYGEEVPSKSASTSSIRSENSPLVPGSGVRRGSRKQQLYALLKARYLHHIRNKWLLFMLLALPSLFVTIAMAFATLRPPADNEIALRLSEDLYAGSTQYLAQNPSIYSDTTEPTFAQRVMSQLQAGKAARDWTQMNTPVCECVLTRQQCSLDHSPRPELMLLPDAATLNTWIVNSHDKYIEKRYGGFTSTLQNNKTNLIAWYNNKGHHAMPAFVNAVNNAILRTVAGSGRNIAAYSHPMKISKEQISKDTVYQHIADAGVSALVLIAFSLVSAGGAIYLVSSRKRQEKRLQLLCGVSPALYWATAMLWDMTIIAINMAITAVVMWMFGFPVFVARNNLPAICVLFLLYGFACGSLVHVLEKLFAEASLANMLLFTGNAFLGLAGITVLLILDIISDSDATDNARWVLHKMFLVSPQFALGDGMLEIAKNTIQAQVLSRFGMDTYRDPFTTSLVSLHCSYLVVVGVVLTLTNLAVEYGYFEWIAVRFTSAEIHKQLDTRVTPESEDVAAERRRVAAARQAERPALSLPTIGNINRGFVHTEGKNNSLARSVATPRACAHTWGLGKAFGERLAVRNLTLSVPRGQCTALLGENGAGKSTTFGMLSGETRPTRGQVCLDGTPRDARTLCRGLISYCPQSDAIDPLLSVRDTLELYCQLRGITEQRDVIRKTMEMFDLTKYGEVRSGALSGGNKRKLCTAVAFMGRTPLVLLDEPTSGMDPMSRACVSRGVASACAGARGVLLSTHALGEARRLGTRVALLRAGELVAVAPLDDCLQRFGGGYVVCCRAASPARAWARVRHAARAAKLRVMHQRALHFLLPQRTEVEKKEVWTRLSDVFRLMATLQAGGDVDDYTVNQSSLEEMFLSFTDKAEANLGHPEAEPLPAPGVLRRNSDQLESITSL